MEQGIGLVNAQGNAVIHSLPRAIRIKATGAVLTCCSTRAYTILIGAKRGQRVQSGDYEGENDHRSAAWVIQNTQEWDRVE